MSAKDYYSILNVSRDASQEEIKKAYRKLAHQHHPDKHSGDEAKFKEVNEAYQVLSDPKKRSQYDNFGSYDGGFQNEGFDFNFQSEDIFDIFSEMFGGGFRRQYEEPRKGEDLYLELQIKTRDFGTNRIVEYDVLDSCSECKGSGVEKGSKIITCQTCKGSGHVRHTRQNGFGLFSQVSLCPTCQGRGKYPEKECHICKGSGRAKTRRVMEIRIPDSLPSHYQVVVPKGGNAGRQDPGDLVIHIKVK
ncbi:MAG TPA: DnaJ domain-containing protein [Candidatus Paceibacterota bacterium]